MTTTENRVSSLVVDKVVELFTGELRVPRYVHGQPNSKYELIKNKVRGEIDSITGTSLTQELDYRLRDRRSDDLVIGLLITFGVCARVANFDQHLTPEIKHQVYTHLNNLLRAGSGGGSET